MIILEHPAYIVDDSICHLAKTIIVLQKNIEEIEQAIAVLVLSLQVRLGSHAERWFSQQFVIHGFHVNYSIVDVNTYPTAASPMLGE